MIRMQNYRTIIKESSYEEIIEKSKFIAHAMPVYSEADAAVFIESIRKRHREATHNVPAWLIGERMEIQRYSDDGEPQGTAGVPMLSMLRNEGLTNVAVVVTRYFGGVKLGTGGLVRAYTHMAKKAVEIAGIVEMKWFDEIALTIAYTLHGRIQQTVSNEDWILLGDTEFTDRVTMKVYVDPTDYERLVTLLIDNSNGQIEIKKGDSIQKPYPIGGA